MNQRSRTLAVVCLCMFSVHAAAEDAFSAATVEQRRGAVLPLDARFTSHAARSVTLSQIFSDKPVVLVFGQYRCPRLCTTMMEGVLLALAASELPRKDYRVVGVSIDPRERAEDASIKLAGYRAVYPRIPLELLTGDAGDIARLAEAVGVHYAFDSQSHDYAHPLALVVVTPDGRISQYLSGVRFDAETLRLALIDASARRIGSVGEALFLRCAHYDPQTGRYTFAAMNAIRAACIALVVVLAVWLWRRSRRARTGRRTH
jgi:protein SCO1/2